MRLEAMARTGGLLAAVALCLGCQIEGSFKRVQFEGVEYDKVFEICRQRLASHYQGVHMTVIPEDGKIETTPKEFNSSKGLRRERVYLDVVEQEDGLVEVAVFAVLAERVIDLDADPPIRWRDLGSDVKQERILLEEITGEVLAMHPDSTVRPTDQ